MFDRIKFFVEYQVIQQIKFYFQRKFRGFSDDEVWDLDNAIIRYTLPRLKHLRKHNHGFPIDFYIEARADEAAMTEEGMLKWNKTIDKMIYAMELILKDEYWYTSSPTWEMDTEAVKEGMELFHQYFQALWD